MKTNINKYRNYKPYIPLLYTPEIQLSAHSGWRGPGSTNLNP